MAAPNFMGGNILYFDTAAQEITTGFRIRAIVWNPIEGKVITANDDVHLIDAATKTILKKRAVADGDGFSVSFPGNGVTVIGIKANELDGGVVYVYGDRL